MNVFVSEIPHGSYSVFDTSIGEQITMIKVGFSGLVVKSMEETKLLVPVYPITPEMFRATAELMEYAEKHDQQSLTLVFCGSDMGVFAR